MTEQINIAEAGEFCGNARVVSADDFERVVAERDALAAKVQELEAKLNDDHWPWGATVKLAWDGGVMNYGPTFGWAKRDASGALVSAYSLTPLNPDDWEVVEERSDQSAETPMINPQPSGD